MIRVYVHTNDLLVFHIDGEGLIAQGNVVDAQGISDAIVYQLTANSLHEDLQVPADLCWFGQVSSYQLRYSQTCE